MSNLRLFLLCVFFSFGSFMYVNAQTSVCSENLGQATIESLQPQKTEIGCPTSMAQNILPSENFLTKCIEKLVNAVSMTAIMEESEIDKETEESSCNQTIEEVIEI